jgi:hypothetical protein
MHLDDGTGKLISYYTNLGFKMEKYEPDRMIVTVRELIFFCVPEEKV